MRVAFVVGLVVTTKVGDRDDLIGERACFFGSCAGTNVHDIGLVRLCSPCVWLTKSLFLIDQVGIVKVVLVFAVNSNVVLASVDKGM